MQQVSPHYLRGAVFGLAAVSIWAGWSAMTRLAVITNLDAWDIPALRFGVAGLLLLPIVSGGALPSITWDGLGSPGEKSKRSASFQPLNSVASTNT